MNTPKSTPGPWTNNPTQDTIWANDGDLKIATVADLPWKESPSGKLQSDWQTEQANARLIAASPDLLDALQELRAYADLKLQGHRQDYPEHHCMVQTALRMIELADKAIAKATQ